VDLVEVAKGVFPVVQVACVEVVRESRTEKEKKMTEMTQNDQYLMTNVGRVQPAVEVSTEFTQCVPKGKHQMTSRMG